MILFTLSEAFLLYTKKIRLKKNFSSRKAGPRIQKQKSKTPRKNQIFKNQIP